MPNWCNNIVYDPVVQYCSIYGTYGLMPILNDSEQLLLYYCTKYHFTQQAVLLMNSRHSHAHIPEGNLVFGKIIFRKEEQEVIRLRWPVDWFTCLNETVLMCGGSENLGAKSK